VWAPKATVEAGTCKGSAALGDACGVDADCAQAKFVADHRKAPVNALGYLRVMFTVEDIDDTLARLRKLGAELVGEVVKYEDSYRLCYIRGPEGLLIGLAQELS
jgi:predicted enzyme related to lactoylglutathione lyase